MEAVAKCSNLVLPKGFVELDREEMTYVDGGAYISQSTVDSIMVSIGMTACSLSIAAVATAVQCSAWSIAATLSAIPVVGPIIGILGVAYLTAQAWDIAEALCVSMIYRKGIDVNLSWWWFVPNADFNARR